MNVQQRACTDKVPFTGPIPARAAAERQNDEVEARDGRRPYTAYKCAFDGRHWHVGHPPSMNSLEAIAKAIRERAYPTEEPT